LSAAAVQRRIAAMEEVGVIAAHVAQIDPDALALPITAIVEVHLRDERAATVDAAKALFRAAPEVQQCYYVTGGISFVLIIISQDMRAYEALTRRLFSESDLVERFRTLVALDRVKAGMSLPLD
jgi:DNA-binding Lrp family transcriptional regulator